MAICIGCCFSKRGIIELGFNFAVAPFFCEEGRFLRLFSENCHQRAIGSSGGPFGVVLLSPPGSFWMVLLGFLLWGGAALILMLFGGADVLTSFE